jgi:hypothetical protein
MGCEVVRRFGKTCIPIRQSEVSYVTSKNAVTFTVTALKNLTTMQEPSPLQGRKPHNNKVTFTVTAPKTSQQCSNLHCYRAKNLTRMQ